MVGVKTKNKNDLSGFFGSFGATKTQAIIPETAKPEIAETVNKSEYRFAENEYLLWALEKCLHIFSVESDSVCRVAQYIISVQNKMKEICADSICFCYPTSSAYSTALKLADAVLMHESGEITDETLKAITDEFIRAHCHSNQIADWMQQKDAPLWSIKIFHNRELLDVQIGNSVQVAIIAAVWSAMRPECHHEIEKA